MIKNLRKQYILTKINKRKNVLDKKFAIENWYTVDKSWNSKPDFHKVYETISRWKNQLMKELFDFEKDLWFLISVIQKTDLLNEKYMNSRYSYRKDLIHLLKKRLKKEFFLKRFFLEKFILDDWLKKMREVIYKSENWIIEIINLWESISIYTDWYCQSKNISYWLFDRLKKSKFSINQFLTKIEREYSNIWVYPDILQLLEEKLMK